MDSLLPLHLKKDMPLKKLVLQNTSRGGGGRGRGPRKSAPRPQPYDRNKFLQANFRFLVSDAADLRKHEADADLMLDWDDIVQVCLPGQGHQESIFLTLATCNNPFSASAACCGHLEANSMFPFRWRC
jgi:hypothetical protein